MNVEANVEANVNDLARGARGVAQATSPAEVFKSLLDSSRAASPRACVFLVRRGEILGWGSVGYPTDVATAQRSFRCGMDGGWLGRVVSDPGPAPVAGEAAADHPDFGQARPARTVGCAIRIDGKPVAILVGEAGEAESPWLDEGLALLVAVAQLRLELGLARRRAAEAESRAAAAPSTPSAEPASAEAPTPVADEAQERPPVDQPTQAASPALETARRYARLVATDIKLYNEEAVMLGRRNGDLIDRIGEHLDRGKETFLQRHADLGGAGIEALHEAFVQVLAGGDDGLIPSSRLQ